MTSDRSSLSLVPGHRRVRCSTLCSVAGGPGRGQGDPGWVRREFGAGQPSACKQLLSLLKLVFHSRPRGQWFLSACPQMPESAQRVEGWGAMRVGLCLLLPSWTLGCGPLEDDVTGTVALPSWFSSNWPSVLSMHAYQSCYVINHINHQSCTLSIIRCGPCAQNKREGQGWTTLINGPLAGSVPPSPSYRLQTTKSGPGRQEPLCNV